MQKCLTDSLCTGPCILCKSEGKKAGLAAWMEKKQTMMGEKWQDRNETRDLKYEIMQKVKDKKSMR